MAKNESIFPFRGTLGKMVFTRGKYGDDVRAKRGTYKPVTINETLKANANRSAMLNGLVSPLYQLLCMHSAYYRDGSAWARMLSALRKAKSDNRVDLLQQLRGMDMHEKYLMNRVWPYIPSPQIQVGSKQLNVGMQACSAPSFSKKIRTNVYRYHLTAYFLPESENQWQYDTAYTEWMPYTSYENAYDFCFDKPYGNGVFLLVMKLEAGNERGALGVMESVRIGVFEVGEY